MDLVHFGGGRGVGVGVPNLADLYFASIAKLALNVLEMLVGENQKGTAGRGREKIRHDNLRQPSGQITTFYDTLRHFMTISVTLFH